MKWAKSRVRKSASRAMDAGRDRNQIVTISVILLDHTEKEFRVGKRDRGQVLLDQVFKSIRCKEPKYYGLQFPQDVPDCMKWLDPTKSIRKQFKRGYPLLLYYRIKYYIFDISRIKDDSTRYELFLQIKLEILEQRLACPSKVAPILAAYAIQSELGDYHPSTHDDDYVKNFRFLRSQSNEFDIEVKRLHRTHKGLSPSQAEHLFLQEAKRIKRYGVEIHHGKDTEGHDIEIGVATDGMGIFRNGELRHKYEWAKIVKISFKRKLFCIQLQKDKVKDKEVPMIEFSMDSYRACKRLWKNCVDCHSFYRTEKERINRRHRNNGSVKSERPIFGFFSGGKSKSRYENAEKEILQFRNPQKSSSSKNLNATAVKSSRDDVKEVRRLSAPPSVSMGVMQNQSYPDYCSDHDSPIISSGKRSYRNHNSVSNEPSLDSEPISEELVESSYSDSAFQQCARSDAQAEDHIILPDNVNLIRLKPDEQGRFGFNIKGGVDQNVPITISKIAPGSPADISSPRLNVGDEIVQINGREANTLSHEEVVNFIRNARERFGGELVLLARPFIVDAYDEAVYVAEVPAPVPRIIENGPIMPREQEVTLNGLEYSMTVLAEQLRLGKDMKLFEKLERKNPDLTMKDAKLPVNLSKNRYRDISPYDVTRVKLTEWESDYINANHIVMEVPETSTRNHYIACQGPLPNTCWDFWAMVCEQDSTLIVMVTTTIERGMMKCYQYWPSEGKSVTHGDITVTSISEEATSCFVFREFEIEYIDAKEDATVKRNVSHIQYVAWPDHGVPDEASDFLYFIACVRQKRVGMKVPTVVHCSAGIGRTGVMIAVETAMCLIESNKPVFPLQITRFMRNQRAMMIQTPLQFRFVCEAILKVYNDGIAKPEQPNISECED